MENQIGLTLKQIIERRDYLGGSDISVISGMNKFQDEFQLWEFKKGIYTPTEENISNKFTNAGNVFEDVVLDMFKQEVLEDYNQEIEYTGIKHVNHPDYKFLQSHPDEVLSNGDIVDAKTGNSKSFTNKWGTEQVPKTPKEYQYQLIYNAGIYYRATRILPKKLWIPVMMMTSKDYDIAEILAEKGQVATTENLIEYYLTEREYAAAKQQAVNVYNKKIQQVSNKDIVNYPKIELKYLKRKVYLKLKKKFQIRVINFNMQTFEAIEKNAIDWWTKFIIGDKVPKITYKSTRYLKQKYKYADEGSEIELGEDLDKAVSAVKASRYRTYQLKDALSRTDEAKELEKAYQLADYNEVLLLNKMKQAETAIGQKAIVTATNTVGHSMNYEKLKSEYPEIYNDLVDKKILKIEISDRYISIKDIFSK